MTPAEAQYLRELKGRFVQIKWHDPADDWPYYRLLEVRSRTKTIKLRGMDFPKHLGGWKHDGNEFWADWSDVREIEPVMVRI